MLRRTSRALVIVALLMCAGLPRHARASSQAEESQRVFRSVSESVFLVEMLSEDGRKPVATGTAFLIDSRTLFTNAHVVIDGRCHVRISAVRVPCKVERRDSRRDLATLVVESELLAPPLAFATGELRGGSTVYVVSNPLGLERTITQGLFSGTRSIDGDEFMQFSAAVSPGSSGGPLVDASGQVVGVVTLSLKAGQLVNLAVPISVVSAFLTNTLELSTYAGVSDRLEDIAAASKDVPYSTEPSSAWQRILAERRVLLSRGLEVSKTSADLVDLAGRARWIEDEIALEAARRAVSLSSRSGEALLLLTDILHSRLISSSSAEERAIRGKEALAAVQAAAKVLGDNEATLYYLGAVQQGRRLLQDAYSAFSRAATSPGGRTWRVLSSLFEVAVGLERRSEAERLLDELLRHPDRNALSLVFLAMNLQEREEFAWAGRAYDGAGAFVPSNWCEAAEMWWKASEEDEAIGSARACLAQVPSRQENAPNRAYAHRLLAAILLKRGVLDEALSNARQAIELNGDDAWAFLTLAGALTQLDRNLEAIDAARTAIRLTDGRFSPMHFTLGSAYFNLKRWNDARAAYEIAARLAPENAEATFNVAVSIANGGQRRDAVYWLEETLRRKPGGETKARAERLLREIRGF